MNKQFYFLKYSSKHVSPEELNNAIWVGNPLGVEEISKDNARWYVAYFGDEDARDNVTKVLQDIKHVMIIETGNILQQDWVGDWMREMKPKRIGRQIIIVYNIAKTRHKNKHVITIIPATAFGTGLHESTELCLKALEILDVKGSLILDVGCGTGILAFLALMKGARKAVAIDIDEDAIRETIRNSYYNGLMKKIMVILGMSDCFRDVKFDVILSNLTGDSIVENMELIMKLLKAHGQWIFSGLTRKEKKGIAKHLKRFPGKVAWKVKNDWACGTFTKK
ncbi:MAG: hypothetical protein A2Y62_02955 [Candidatus Fischerbacteria bacterium RBG_13_37_8]|uniref:Ribosomal protein L11 methyltransferase n=1 Tax=Candidatus Fischerbacteria bacterium RBG_13_37_8 TaxID=1817863 RepID=A0A1F5VEG4_9BACT|nr:MAG: hypothetical protein A2Y62_02955 [Candidatus Fischerbacteria bacterium RBG_13_37_8]